MAVLHVSYPFEITGVAHGDDAGDGHVTWSSGRVWTTRAALVRNRR